MTKSARSAVFSYKILTLLVVAMMVTVSGCKKDYVDDRRTAAELYSEAKQSMDDGNWASAAREYRILQTRYPFGRYTEQSMLDLSYCAYKGGQGQSALSMLDRFLRTYPAHPNVDYAYYLKGLINYDETLGLLEKLMPERVRATATRRRFAIPLMISRSCCGGIQTAGMPAMHVSG